MTTRKEKIYIIVSIIFISFMILFYGGRFIYYYKTSHVVKESGQTLLADVIKSLSYNKTMIKEGENIYYSGKALNNYLYYSNRYYRIVGVEDNKVVLVDDSIATILKYNNPFEESDIYLWLNKKDENSGVYYDSLDNPGEYLANTITCIDNYSGSDITCENKVESLVGLLSINQYIRANNETGNYLNNDNYYWFVNRTSEEENWYVNSDNEIDYTSKDNIYGVRPTITLKEDILYYGGTGTYYDPYFVNEDDMNSIENGIGTEIKYNSYINYSDNTWKVIGVYEDKYKLVLNNTLDKMVFSSRSNVYNISDNNSLASYLNNDFYNTLDKKYLVAGDFYIGSYDESYNNKYSNKVNANVGLLEIGDLYINDFTNSYTLINNGKGKNVYTVINGRLYADSYKNENLVRPVIYLSKNIKILSGNGNIDNPYEVGEV